MSEILHDLVGVGAHDDPASPAGKNFSQTNRPATKWCSHWILWLFAMVWNYLYPIFWSIIKPEGREGRGGRNRDGAWARFLLPVIKKLKIWSEPRDSRVVVGADPYKIVQNSDIVSHRLQTVSAALKLQALRRLRAKTKKRQQKIQTIAPFIKKISPKK